MKTATQNISIFALNWSGLYNKDGQKITKCDNLMSKISQRRDILLLIAEIFFSASLNVEFRLKLHQNLIFGVFFLGVTPEKFMYFDPNSTCNGDKTTRTVITNLLTLCYHVLNIKLPFFRVLCCFLRRHLPRLSSL